VKPVVMFYLAMDSICLLRYTKHMRYICGRFMYIPFV
jgi:hypothetical protein